MIKIINVTHVTAGLSTSCTGLTQKQKTARTAINTHQLDQNMLTSRICSKLLVSSVK